MHLIYKKQCKYILISNSFQHKIMAKQLLDLLEEENNLRKKIKLESDT